MNPNAQLQFANAADMSRAWQIPAAETVKIKDTSTGRYAIVAVAFGLLFGITVAATTGNGISAVGSPDVASADSIAANAGSQVVSQHALAVAPHAQAGGQRIASASPALVTVNLQRVVSHRSAAHYRRHGAHRTAARKIALVMPAVVQAIVNVPAPASSLPASEQTKTNEVVAASYVMEGDATVADFNATTGMIETDEGKTFMLDKAETLIVAEPLGDYHRNVHYRCDQAGNCTLRGAGVVVSNAKLT
jgi:hypothetical protein